MRNYQFTAHIGREQETGLYFGIVPTLPGAHTQAETLDELQENLKEVIGLCLEELDLEEFNASEFVGLQQISVAV
ncbi:MAG: type II toxin-antitoxin system HicB family antitoxin [Bacteroidota bacterium]